MKVYSPLFLGSLFLAADAATPLGKSLSPLERAIGDDCSYWDSGKTYKGSCTDSFSCAYTGNFRVKNKCPNDKSSIKCCIHADCHDNNRGHGWCYSTNEDGAGFCEGKGGYFKKGLCPGPSTVQCCILWKE